MNLNHSWCFYSNVPFITCFNFDLKSEQVQNTNAVQQFIKGQFKLNLDFLVLKLSNLGPRKIINICLNSRELHLNALNKLVL